MSLHPALIDAVRPHAVAAAFCALIPIPIVDELISRRCLGEAVKALARHHDRPLADEAVAVLVEDRSNRLVGCLRMAVVWPLKKLFRTVFFFLAVKDVFDNLAVTAHRLDMLDAALGSGLLPGDPAGVRTAMDATLARYRTSPVTRAIFGYERPALDSPVPADAMGRLIHSTVRLGGGALVRADFLSRVGSST